MDLRRLSDQKLLNEIKNLVKQEQAVIVQIIDHLQEVERRKLYCDLKYQSLYEYCFEELGYSKDQAYRRIQAMRLAYKKPEVKQALKRGELSLSTANSLGTFLKEAPQINSKSLVKKLAHKSKRETEKILDQERADLNIEVKPRSVKIEIDEETLVYLRQIQKPAESLQETIKRISKIESETKKKSLAPKRKRKTSSDKNSRFIQKKVKHAVMSRANRQCENCGSSHQLQFEHKKPFALGGSNSEENLAVLCRNCNLRSGIKVFGADRMNRASANSS